MIGQTVGHYRILEKLGQGGMGVVYRAEDLRLGRDVALKALPAEFARDPTRRQRFQQEARAAAALNHAGIAAVYQLEEAGDDLYIVFEYVRGENLRELISRRALKLDAVLQLAAQMADALAAAHAGGVVHRDLKPENVIRTPDGQPKILDFGLARFAAPSEEQQPTASVRLTSPGMIVGTVSYMSPEQLNGEEPDFRSDIFSFGVMLYELITGARPFDGPTAAATMSRSLTAEPPPITAHNAAAPAELERIIRKCLRKKPGERYQSTRDLAVDLQVLQRESGSVPAATSAPEPPPQAAPEDSDFLRQPGMLKALNPRRWWEFHQTVQLFIPGLVIYLAWLARGAGAEVWIFPAILVVCAALISLRIFLLSTALFNPADVAARVRAIDRWLSVGGFAAVVILGYAGVRLFNQHTGLASLLIAVAIAGVVNVFFIESAIRRAAFPRSSEQRAAAGEKFFTPLRWWQLNHLFCLGMTPLVLYFVWLANDARKDALGLWLWYISLGFASVLISLRLYQLCVAMFMSSVLAREVGRVEPWQRGGDLVFMAVLLATAISVATKSVGVAAFLGVIALGGVITRLLVEPAISRAAFEASGQIPESRAARDTSAGKRWIIAAIQFLFTAPLVGVFFEFSSFSDASTVRALTSGDPSLMLKTIGFRLAAAAVILNSAITIGGILLGRRRAIRWLVLGFPLFVIQGMAALVILIFMTMRGINLGAALLLLPVLAWLPVYQRRLAKELLGPGEDSGAQQDPKSIRRLAIAGIQFIFLIPYVWIFVRIIRWTPLHLNLAMRSDSPVEVVRLIGEILLVVAALLAGTVFSLAILMGSQKAAEWMRRGIFVFLLMNWFGAIFWTYQAMEYVNLPVAIVVMPVLVFLPMFQRHLLKQIGGLPAQP
jgi:predicted Ser/Thr protein kinase